MSSIQMKQVSFADFDAAKLQCVNGQLVYDGCARFFLTLGTRAAPVAAAGLKRFDSKENRTVPMELTALAFKNEIAKFKQGAPCTGRLKYTLALDGGAVEDTVLRVLRTLATVSGASKLPVYQSDKGYATEVQPTVSWKLVRKDGEQPVLQEDKLQVGDFPVVECKVYDRDSVLVDYHARKAAEMLCKPALVNLIMEPRVWAKSLSDVQLQLEVAGVKVLEETAAEPALKRQKYATLDAIWE